MRLHNRLASIIVTQANKVNEPEAIALKRAENAYNRAKPFINLLKDLIKSEIPEEQILKELKEGNPNVERLIFWREGWKACAKRTLSILDPEEKQNG